MPRKEPSQSLDCRVGFETSFDQDDRMTMAAKARGISVAELIRQAVEAWLRKRKL